MEWTCTPCKAADIADCAAMERDFFSQPWSERALWQAADDGSVFTVLRAGGRVAGYFLALRVLDEAQVVRVAVREDLRGRGAGRALLAAGLAQAAGDGARVCFLEVRHSNAAAIGLYKHAGFVEFGIRKNFYEQPREDALMMRLELGGGGNG